MANVIELNEKLVDAEGKTANVTVGESIRQALVNSPSQGKGLEKVRLARRINKRMEGDGQIEFTASEVTLISGSLENTFSWAYEQLIKHIDPAQWKKIMEPETETVADVSDEDA